MYKMSDAKGWANYQADIGNALRQAAILFLVMET
jgi:hypothetical protein